MNGGGEGEGDVFLRTGRKIVDLLYTLSIGVVTAALTQTMAMICM